MYLLFYSVDITFQFFFFFYLKQPYVFLDGKGILKKKLKRINLCYMGYKFFGTTHKLLLLFK